MESLTSLSAQAEESIDLVGRFACTSRLRGGVWALPARFGFGDDQSLAIESVRLSSISDAGPVEFREPSLYLSGLQDLTILGDDRAMLAPVSDSYFTVSVTRKEARVGALDADYPKLEGRSQADDIRFMGL